MSSHQNTLGDLSLNFRIFYPKKRNQNLPAAPELGPTEPIFIPEKNTRFLIILLRPSTDFMNYILRSNHISLYGKTFLLPSSKYGYYSKMINSMLNQLFAMSSHHSKLFVLRLELRQYESSPNNKRITDFNRRFFGQIQAKYGVTRIGFAWTREQHTSPYPHYHYILFLDGQKVRSSHALVEMAKAIWSFMDGSLWVPPNCYQNLKRDDWPALQKATVRISYLAKAYTKELNPKSCKNYGTSRIKLKAA